MEIVKGLRKMKLNVYMLGISILYICAGIQEIGRGNILLGTAYFGLTIVNGCFAFL